MLSGSSAFLEKLIKLKSIKQTLIYLSVTNAGFKANLQISLFLNYPLCFILKYRSLLSYKALSIWIVIFYSKLWEVEV